MDSIITKVRFKWEEITDTHFIVYDEYKSKYYVDYNTESKTRVYSICNSKFTMLRVGDKVNLNGTIRKIKDVIFNLDETIDYICESISNSNSDEFHSMEKRCKELNDKVNRLKDNKYTKIVRNMEMPTHEKIIVDEENKVFYVKLRHEPIFEQIDEKLKIVIIDINKGKSELSDNEYTIDGTKLIFNKELNENVLIYIGSYVYLSKCEDTKYKSFDTTDCLSYDKYCNRILISSNRLYYLLKEQLEKSIPSLIDDNKEYISEKFTLIDEDLADVFIGKGITPLKDIFECNE